jgi:hypothetical protein
MPAVLPMPDTGVASDATLPGLRGLSDLADLRPKITRGARLRLDQPRPSPVTEEKVIFLQWVIDIS